MMKTLFAKRFDIFDMMSLKDVASVMRANLSLEAVDCVNWPNVASGGPSCGVAVAFSENNLYVHFVVEDEDLRAVNTQNLSPVADDSCVEFFMQIPSKKEYWNFEFNCIGTVNASHREARPNATRLTDEEIASIGRYSSCGIEPFDLLPGQHVWSLTVAIPKALVGADSECASIMGNFYKCGGKTIHPHYLSWNAIVSEKPNFHLPEFFGRIILDSNK